MSHINANGSHTNVCGQEPGEKRLAYFLQGRSVTTLGFINVICCHLNDAFPGPGPMEGTCLTAAGHSLQGWSQRQACLRWVKVAKEISSCCLPREVSLPACAVPVLHPHCVAGAGAASWELAGKSWGSLEFMGSQLLRV